MSQTYTTDDLKVLFAYPFQDPDWKKKFLIGSLLVIGGYIIPIIPFIIIYGYIAQIMRRIIVEKGEPFLPEWDDWGKLLTDGFKLLGAVFVYTLPFILLFCAGYAVFFLSLGLTGVAGAAAEQGGEAPSPMIAIFPIIGMFGMFAMLGIVMVLGLLLGFVMPAIMGHVIATDEFVGAFRIREWWSIFRINIGGFLMAYIIVLAMSAGLSFGLYLIYFTIILCCFLPVIMAPVTMYMTVIQGVVYGEAYREGVQKLENQASASESL